MKKRQIHPVRLGAKISNYGLVAAVEISSAMNYPRFRDCRIGFKEKQAIRAKEHIQYCISRYNQSEAGRKRNLAHDIEVVSGLGIFTHTKPDETREKTDFSITLFGTHPYRFERAYENMLRDEYVEEEARDLGKIISELRGVELAKLVENDFNEKTTVASQLRLEFEYFDELLALIRGKTTEHYFKLFFEDYFKEPSSLIIHSIEYNYQKWNHQEKRFQLKRSEMDLLIACDRKKFYDTLNIIDKTSGFEASIES